MKEVALGDVIELKITNLGDVLKNCANQTIVLYLNGYSMTSLKPGPLTIPNANTLRFTLKFISDVRNIGADPRLSELRVSQRGRQRWRAGTISRGVQGDAATANRWKRLVLHLARPIRIAGRRVLLVCAQDQHRPRSNPADEAAGIRRTYSLSKTQGAVWLFVILAAYLLIGLVTGDFATSINSTALILLGIGAGTVLGSAVIDASKEAQNGAVNAKAIADTKAKLGAIDQNLVQTRQALANSNLPPQQQAFLSRVEIDQCAEKESTLSAYRKLTGQNEQFLTDILSDANGVSFHRFQMAAWTWY